MIDFTYLNQYFPIIVFALCGLCLFPKRHYERSRFPLWMYLFLTFAFIQPSYIFQHFAKSDLSFFSMQSLTALLLIVTRRVCASEENWLKAAVSFILAIFFLYGFHYPTLGMPFEVPPLWEKALIVSSLIVALFLLFGIPPLQLGAVDLGSERNTRLQLPATLIFRFVLCYYFLLSLQTTTWFISFIDYEPLIIGSLFLGLTLSHLTLRLQTNVYRIFAYLSSVLVLCIAVQFTYVNYAAAMLVGFVMLFMPLIILLNPIPNENARDLDLWNVTNFQKYHPTSSKHFFSWLKVVLTAEIILGIAIGIKLVMDRNYLSAVAALVFVCSIVSVLGDKQAFVAKTEN